MQPSDKALDLIKRFEGCRLRAYKCPAGVWTIGWGTTRIAGKPVKPGLEITQGEADLLLEMDADWHWSQANRSIRDPGELHQCQVDALTSFVFNVGIGAFSRSTLLKKINAGDARGASDEFLKWNKAGGRVLQGLTRRRHAERKLFMECLA